MFLACVGYINIQKMAHKISFSAPVLIGPLYLLDGIGIGTLAFGLGLDN